jgi:glycosyltransferase involved in cell wall biosynthesis
MKLALITPFPPYRGGISKHSENLYNELRKNNDVIVYSFSRLYPEILFPGTNQYLDNSEYNDTKSIRSIDSLNPKTWKLTSENILEKKIDHVVIRYWNPFFIFAYSSIIKYLRKRNKKIKIFTICDNIISHENLYFEKLLVKSFIRKLDGIIVMSDNVKRKLLILNNNINYKKIFLPILEDLGDKINIKHAKKELSLNSDKIVFLFFGLIREYKGLDVLISAINLIDKDLIDKFEFIIAGENYEKLDKYKNNIDADIKGNIKWLTKYIPDEQVNLYFCASDFVVLPYKSASQSGIVPMAYHFGKPIIVSDVEGLSEMVVNYITGYIFENKNINDLKYILENCIINSKNDIDENMINRFSRKLSTRKYAQNIINFLNE